MDMHRRRLFPALGVKDGFGDPYFALGDGFELNTGLVLDGKV